MTEATQVTRDLACVAALLDGSDQAFRELVERCQPAMLRLANVYSPSGAVAEEIVQESWMAVLDGLASYQGQAQLRSWICSIVVNIARRYSARESRATPLATLAHAEGEGHDSSVAMDRFFPPGSEYAGHWRSLPSDWSERPETAALSQELRDVIYQAVETLPEAQRVVVVLRDLEGWAPDEVATVLQVTAGHQRVLLHRGRAKVRTAVEHYVGT
ncbi:RNA polymerase sigma factor [Nocardioides plantarum]|uniref:RNA polymerase sigma factor n=1 Tax=Nocardioides plantarum TaxID=29299 RepID=A0ABV5KAP8_9ACTN|nr:sigma-70 family RNA polymerase sigma factor [Nocardioides plantarum]